MTSILDVKSNVQTLSSLSKIHMVSKNKIQLDSLKLFNRLIIIGQWDMIAETSLQYELTPLPIAMFSNIDQKMNNANKDDFSKTSLNVLTNPLDLHNQPATPW